MPPPSGCVLVHWQGTIHGGDYRGTAQSRFDPFGTGLEFSRWANRLCDRVVVVSAASSKLEMPTPTSKPWQRVGPSPMTIEDSSHSSIGSSRPCTVLWSLAGGFCWHHSRVANNIRKRVRTQSEYKILPRVLSSNFHRPRSSRFVRVARVRSRGEYRKRATRRVDLRWL
jgi:hypothetical protein